MEICRSAKWGVRTEVRLAVAMNPFSPPGLTLRLLPQLAVSNLRKIAASEQMAGEVRAAARILADRHSETASRRIQETVWVIETAESDEVDGTAWNVPRGRRAEPDEN